MKKIIGVVVIIVLAIGIFFFYAKHTRPDAGPQPLQVKGQAVAVSPVLEKDIASNEKSNNVLNLQSHNVLVVPSSAVHMKKNQHYVWLVGGDNKIVKAFVQVGPKIGKEMVIKEGLALGDQVIMGHKYLKEGTVVQANPSPLS